MEDVYDKLISSLGDLDDAADEIDQAVQYTEWFLTHISSIQAVDKARIHLKFIRNLWARFGRAQYTFMQYAQSQKKRDSEPETIDIYNPGHRPPYAAHYVYWKWYDLSGNMNSNFPIDIRNTTKDMHGKRAVQLVSYYIRKDRNYVRK